MGWDGMGEERESLIWTERKKGNSKAREREREKAERGFTFTWKGQSEEHGQTLWISIDLDPGSLAPLDPICPLPSVSVSIWKRETEKKN